jgi:CheY-like chemotaxis protein
MAVKTLRSASERDSEVRRVTEIVERQSRHLSRLLDDLLDAARLAREKVELRKTTTTLQNVVTEALEIARELVEVRGHTVALSVPDTPICLEADPTRLAQVVANLLNNAAKYTPHGGRIAVTAAADRGEAVVCIRDSGIGISPETLTRIFEPFAQGERTLARSDGGLGIGLTLARMLVQLHDGTLTAASGGPGHGSEFVMRVPLGAPAPTEPGPVSRPGPRAAPRRVLVIEDNEDAREIMQLTLERDGHLVQTAADGAAGLELALQSRPDIVMVDIGLPAVDGYAVAQRLRAELGDAVLLVAVTGYGRQDDRQRAVTAGFDVHLTKPIDYDDVIRLLQECEGPRPLDRAPPML